MPSKSLLRPVEHRRLRGDVRVPVRPLLYLLLAWLCNCQASYIIYQDNIGKILGMGPTESWLPVLTHRCSFSWTETLLGATVQLLKGCRWALGTRYASTAGRGSSDSPPSSTLGFLCVACVQASWKSRRNHYQHYISVIWGGRILNTGAQDPIL